MKEDVSIIYAEDNTELILDSVSLFKSDNVSLISSGINTSYMCYYNENFDYIMKINQSKSFQMLKGTLKYKVGNSLSSSLLLSSSFYFININEESYLLLSYIKIIFGEQMSSMICIESGSVYIEYMKIVNEKWIQPLIEVNKSMSSIIIEIYMSSIIKSNYTSQEDIESSGSYKYKSGIIYICNTSISNIILNISNCLFNKNILNLFYNDSGNGNFFHFSGLCETSCMT
jgi:hypothetical protein